MFRAWPPSRHLGAIVVALLGVAFVIAVTTKASRAPAVRQAKEPCWQRLLASWVAGRDLSAYPVHCYTAAQRNLPDDLRSYSTAPTDISRALQAAIRDTRVSDGVERTSAIVHHRSHRPLQRSGN